jgi:hypothetical protein
VRPVPSVPRKRQTYLSISAASGGLVRERAVSDYLEGRRKPRAATKAAIDATLVKLGFAVAVQP